MCNIFSGHISFAKEDFGKVYFLSMVHHEKDRELIPHEQLLAWETVKEFTFEKGFKFVHGCGKRVDNKTKDALMEILVSWSKKQNIVKLYNKLINDSDYDVRCTVARRTDITPEQIETLSNDTHWCVRSEIASRTDLTKEQIQRLSNDTHWYVRCAIQQRK